MNKKCPNCGADIEAGRDFCGNCGTKIEGNTQETVTYQTQGSTGKVSFAERNIIMAIVLSIVTCGIYGIYWTYKLVEESNEASGETTPSPISVILLAIVTCGIYELYWYYIVGKRMQVAGQRHGVQIEERSVLYLILGIVGLAFVNDILIQVDLNKVANSNM